MNRQAFQHHARPVGSSWRMAYARTAGVGMRVNDGRPSYHPSTCVDAYLVGQSIALCSSWA